MDGSGRDAASLRPSRRVSCVAWGDPPRPAQRAVPEETAVALTYNRATYAVMMATPADLEDFAVGFSLSEGVVDRPDQIEELEVIPGAHGVEVRMWIGPGRRAALDERRRRFAGPTGCGLCGLDSLQQAVPPLPRVGDGAPISPAALRDAVAGLAARQILHRETRAVHAAGLWRPGAGLCLVREDVGRHNALDKLAGASANAGLDAGQGAVAMTSRVSVELVQKAARMGVPVLIAVSAPTALAIRAADEAEITLIGVARDDGFEIFTHPRRVPADAGAAPPG